MQTRVKLLSESLNQANSTLKQQEEMVCRMERLISESILRERHLKSRITKIEEVLNCTLNRS
ncbi:hypothetical protein BKA69DRAFT_1078323 [Paraphysoderma sedebokerense]|nr:hypothetical protein BKA69DRAFT_1078323 [Paraphysoderma sedebokerense]